MTMRLDTRSIATLDLAGKRDAIFFDDDLPGFGYRLRVGAGGKKILKSWIVQYRRAGSSRRLLLGAGEVLSAEQARAAAKKVLAKIALGEDPQAERADRRGKDRLNLRGVVDEYLAARKPDIRRRTYVGVRRYLTGLYFKPLHGMPIDTVSRRDIAARLVTITREHGSVVASRARAALSTFFVWCLRMGLTESNPTIGVVKPKEGKPRERVLNDQELAAIWRECGDDDYGRIIRLIILLGCRRQEIGGLCWSELDLDRGVWRLPAERSKNGRAHELPLMPMAIDILKHVPRRLTRDQLFGARSGNGFSAWDKCKQELDARSGVVGWTHHDLRRSSATKMADIGIAPHVIEQILGHTSGHKAGVAGIYNRSSYEREVRAALALWADHIHHVVTSRERKVLPLATSGRTII
jgi:integrase